MTDLYSIKTHDSESRGQEEEARLMIVSREVKKTQAVHDKRVSYLHVAPL